MKEVKSYSLFAFKTKHILRLIDLYPFVGLLEANMKTCQCTEFCACTLACPEYQGWERLL